jgi:hypothetical protein
MTPLVQYFIKEINGIFVTNQDPSFYELKRPAAPSLRYDELHMMSTKA